MFTKGNVESKKGGRKTARLLLKKLGSPQEVSRHFKRLAKLKKKKQPVQK